jgi:hypothetical protein
MCEFLVLLALIDLVCIVCFDMAFYVAALEQAGFTRICLSVLQTHEMQSQQSVSVQTVVVKSGKSRPSLAPRGSSKTATAAAAAGGAQPSHHAQHEKLVLSALRLLVNMSACPTLSATLATQVSAFLCCRC